MKDTDVDVIGAWLVERGLAGASETDLLHGTCERCREAGSVDRLDFTVVGPAVNETSRIAAMCRSADRGTLLSSDFREATPESERSRLVSVGRFALRGVGRARELFTLDPGV